MAQLNPVNLDDVLADLQVVVDSTMMLGGQIIDFADPYGRLPEKEKRWLEERQKAAEERLQSIPEHLADIYQPYRPDDYMCDLCNTAWEAMQVSLRRLSVMLEDGDIELLNCPPNVVVLLKTIWTLLLEMRGNKPTFTPGKPDSLWRFTATFGVGMRLRDYTNDLEKIIQVPSGNGPQTPERTSFVANPLQQAILHALDGQALKKDGLAAEVCAGEGSRLYRAGGIKELTKAGLVEHKNGVGYYRPDAPPDGLVIRREPKRH